MAYDYSFGKVWEKIAYLCGACTLFGMCLAYGIAGGGWGWFVVVIVVVIVSAKLIFMWAKDAGNYIAGMTGELRVDAMLTTLPGGEYWHENDVILSKKWNIDHVVVGPNGIWTVETKNHAGDVRVVKGKLMRGNWQYPEKEDAQARGQASELQKYLVEHGCAVKWVQPIVAIARIDSNVDVPGTWKQTLIVGYRDLAAKIRSDRSGGDLNEDERRKIKEVFVQLREKMEAEEKQQDARAGRRAVVLIVLGVISIALATWQLGQIQRH